MHLRVAGAGGVLGRGRRSDDGGIDDRPAPHDPSLTLEDLGLRREQLLPDLVGFEQVSEVEQRGRVRDLLDREVQVHEPPHRIGVVDRVLDSLVGEVEPDLEQVHPQHRGDRLGLATRLARPIGVVARLDQPHPRRPRDRGIHRLQELLTPRDPPTVAVLDISKGRLLAVHDPMISRSPPRDQPPGRTITEISGSLG